MSQHSPSRLPFWANLQLLVLTFVLIGVGGSVTSTKSGMAVPDWPGTGGEFLLFAPFKFWVNDLGRLLEHSHRLIGAAVGMAAIAVAAVNWKHAGERKWLKWFGLLLLSCVILQGLMGGFRVSENNQFLAAVHGVLGQATFALMVLGTCAFAPFWTKGHAAVQPVARAPMWQKVLVAAPLPGLIVSQVIAALRAAPEHESVMQWRLDRFLPFFIASATMVLVFAAFTLRHAAKAWPKAWKDQSRSTRSHAWMVLGLMLAQLCLGAAVRHLPAAHAMPGASMVPLAMNQAKLNARMDELAKEAQTDAAAKKKYDGMMLDAKIDDAGKAYLPAGKIHLHLTHRVVGILIGLLCIGWLAVLKKRKSLVPVPFLPKLAVGGAVALQVALGFFTALSGVHPVYATSHQTMGALLLAACVWLAAWTCMASKENA